MAATGSHLIRYAAGRKRHRYTEPIRRTSFRCSDAPDCQATARCREAETCRGSMVRYRAGGYWLHLSFDRGQCVCESARASYAVVLLVPLHSAQTKNTSMYFGGGLSGSYATSDRLGSGIGY